MALPKQVEKLIKETEALEEQLKAKPQMEVVEQPEKAVEAKEPEVVEEQDTQPDIVEEAVEATEQPVEKAEPDRRQEDELAKADQRYKTLQGMFDAEKKKHRDEVSALSSKLNALEERLTKQQEATKAAEARLQLVTEDDVKNFGEDLVDLGRRTAREENHELESRLNSQLEAIMKENAELRELLKGNTKQTETMGFEQRLYRAIPDFNEVDNDPAWINWLNETDPMLRAPRRAAAAQAFESGDVEAVAHYVRLFKESKAPEQPSKTESKKGELERQIQPTRTAQTNAPVSKQGKLYSENDIQRMFIKLSKMGNSDEARKLEAEIDAAYSEGRVR